MRQNLINESKPTWFHNCFVSNNHHHHEMKLPCQNVWQFLDLKRCFGLSFAELNLQSFISESPPLSLFHWDVCVCICVSRGAHTRTHTHTHTYLCVYVCGVRAHMWAGVHACLCKWVQSPEVDVGCLPILFSALFMNWSLPELRI